MDKKSSEQLRPRIPLEHKGVQVNFCKNPLCKNFGVSAGLDKQKRGASKPKEGQDSYTLSGAGKDSPTIHCLLCNEYPPVKSNKGISEELDRISDYLKEPSEKTCPDLKCDNHTVGIKSNKKSYQSFGKTRSGSPRYRCKSCNKTFSIKRPTTGHKKPYINRRVFSSLVNKMVFNRLCEKDEISAGTLYPKIDFIYKQCLAFVANRERNFSQREMDRLYVSVDRQEYIVNWTKRKDKRNIKLIAAGCADNDSMYVFGMHLNYEPNVDEIQIEEDAIQAGDYDVPFPFRDHARCWLKQDYDNSVKRGIKRNAQRSGKAELTDRINNTYDAVNDLDDVEVSEFHTHTTSLPKRGVQIHSEYTLYGHFFFLNKQFNGIKKVRFFLDQDSGIRAACLAAFQERVSNRTCDAFYVRLTKDMTINEKQQEVNKFKKRLKVYQADNPFLSEEQIKVLMTQDAINNMSEIGKWRVIPPLLMEIRSRHFSLC